MSLGKTPPDRYVLTWVSTAPGGAERSVAELATTLCAQGHQVHVVLWDQAGRTLSPTLPLPFHLTLAEDFTSYRDALELALTGGAMALISTHRTASVDIAAAHRHGVVVLPVLRAMLVDAGRLRMLDAATGHLRAMAPSEVDWHQWAQAHCWVGVSAAATHSLTRHTPRPLRAVTIHNGVAADHLPLSAPERIRRLAVVARLEEWKRIDRVIGAYAALPSWARDRMRLDIYQRFSHAGGIVHAHAPYSLAFASLGRTVPSVTNQLDTLGEIPCLVADDTDLKALVRTGELTVPVPEGIVQRPDVNVHQIIPQLEERLVPRAEEVARHGLGFLIYRHGAFTLARGLYEATENFARIEVAARTALFQSLLLGGIDHVVPNPLFGENTSA